MPSQPLWRKSELTLQTEKKSLSTRTADYGDPVAIVAALDQMYPPGEWLDDSIAYRDAAQSGFPETSKELVQRIAKWPSAPLDPAFVAQFEPLPPAQAFKAVTVTIGYLPSQSGETSLELGLRACTEVAARNGASAADFARVNYWVTSGSGAEGRPHDLEVFTFRPMPGRFDEIIRLAQQWNRSTLDGYGRRAAIARQCKALLVDWHGHVAALERHQQDAHARWRVQFARETAEHEERFARQKAEERARPAREKAERQALALQHAEQLAAMKAECEAFDRLTPTEQERALCAIERGEDWR